MLRDLTFTGLFENSILDIQAGRPVATYLNGQYWGLYNIREKINKDYLASLHEVAEEDLILLENDGEVIKGNDVSYMAMIDFMAQNDLSIPQNFQQVAEQIEVPNFIQYQIANIFIDNKDWPGNNQKYWKTANGKWRWILFDTDFGFKDFSHNTLAFALETDGPSWPNPPYSTFILRKLLEHQNFKHQFINTFADEMNSRLLPEQMLQAIEKNSQRIESEMPQQIARWKGNPFGNIALEDWYFRIEEMKTFAKERATYMRTFIQNEFNLPLQTRVNVAIADPTQGSVQLNSIQLNQANWSGIYFKSVPISLTALPKQGYKFSHWSGSSTATTESITIDPENTLSLTAHFELNANAVLEQPIIFNEINYNSSEEKDAGDWVELYNNGTANQDLSNWIFKDSKDDHVFEIPVGTNLGANEYLVLVRNSEKFTVAYPDVNNKIGDFDFKLSSDGEFIRLYSTENTLVDSLWYLPDGDWPETANGTGPTLELIDPDKDNTLATNWTTFPFNGTPGTVNGVYTTPTFEVNTPTLTLKVTPNPFKDQLSIVVDVTESEVLQIRIITIAGQLIQSWKPSFIQPTQTINLSLPNLNAGIYWLQVIGSEGQVVQKVVKL